MMGPPRFDPEHETREHVRVELNDAPAGRPYLFRVFECHRPTAPPSRHLLDVDELVVGRGHDDLQRDHARLSLAIEDPLLSRTHARIRRVAGTFTIEDAGSRNGTVRNGVRVERAELRDRDLLETGGTFFIFRAA